MGRRNFNRHINGIHPNTWRMSPAQRRYLKGLAYRKGVRYIMPYSNGEFTEEINRLKQLPVKGEE